MIPLCCSGEAIEFVKKLEDMEVKEGSSCELSIEISSDKCHVVWHKDGHTLDKDNSKYSFKSEGRYHSLKISSATVHHEGEYVASVGEQECSCELTVVGKI